VYRTIIIIIIIMQRLTRRMSVIRRRIAGAYPMRSDVGPGLISLARGPRTVGDKPLKSVTPAWPVRHQTYGYLPSRRASPPSDRYQDLVVLLGDRGKRACEQLAQGCFLKAERPGLKPFESRGIGNLRVTVCV